MAKKTNNKSENKFFEYWGKKAHYTALVHIGGGLGVGLLLYPTLANNGTVSLVAWALILLAVLGHLYAFAA